MQNWNFLNNLEVHLVVAKMAIAFGLGFLGKCFASLLCLPFVALIKFSSLIMYAMMQCKTKSENLAHILGYQIWAVTSTQATG